jgi:hypothetical protein
VPAFHLHAGRDWRLAAKRKQIEMHRPPLISAHTSHQRHKSTLGHWARLAPLLNPSYFKRLVPVPRSLSRKSCRVYPQSVKKSCRTRVQLRTTRKMASPTPWQRLSTARQLTLISQCAALFSHRRLVWREILLDDCGCEIDYLCPREKVHWLKEERKASGPTFEEGGKSVFAGVGVCTCAGR